MTLKNKKMLGENAKVSFHFPGFIKIYLNKSDSFGNSVGIKVYLWLLGR